MNLLKKLELINMTVHNNAELIELLRQDENVIIRDDLYYALQLLDMAHLFLDKAIMALKIRDSFPPDDYQAL